MTMSFERPNLPPGQAAPPVGRRAACVVLGSFALASIAAAAAETRTGAAPMPPAADPAVKAAYLVNFLAYVEWPAVANALPESPQVVGVVGDDAVADALERAAAGGSRRGRPTVVRRLRAGDALDGVHLLFLGSGARATPELLAALAGKPVLVVTQSAGGLTGLSAINLVAVGGHLRFEASQAAAERAGLRLSARLLALAERVQGSGDRVGAP